MPIEVEQKFPVPDLQAVVAELAGLGAEVSSPREEVDRYFAHPARDFAATDEALRIRRVGSAGYITYKGPKLDPLTKTRREIELPLGTLTPQAEGWDALLEALGFRPVAEVRKHRRKAFVGWEGQRVEASLDEVEQVGTFVELELVVEAAETESAKTTIASLAKRLGLHQSERRSYLELLLLATP